jgi:hypothetical protein
MNCDGECRMFNVEHRMERVWSKVTGRTSKVTANPRLQDVRNSPSREIRGTADLTGESKEIVARAYSRTDPDTRGYRDYGFLDQLRCAAISTMNNIGSAP